MGVVRYYFGDPGVELYSISIPFRFEPCYYWKEGQQSDMPKYIQISPGEERDIPCTFVLCDSRFIDV